MLHTASLKALSYRINPNIVLIVNCHKLSLVIYTLYTVYTVYLSIYPSIHLSRERERHLATLPESIKIKINMEQKTKTMVQSAINLCKINNEQNKLTQKT